MGHWEARDVKDAGQQGEEPSARFRNVDAELRYSPFLEKILGGPKATVRLSCMLCAVWAGLGVHLFLPLQRWSTVDVLLFSLAALLLSLLVTEYLPMWLSRARWVAKPALLLRVSNGVLHFHGKTIPVDQIARAEMRPARIGIETVMTGVSEFEFYLRDGSRVTIVNDVINLEVMGFLQKQGVAVESSTDPLPLGPAVE